MSDLTFGNVVWMLELIDAAEDVDIELQSGEWSVKVTRARAQGAPRPMASEADPKDRDPPLAAPPAAPTEGAVARPDFPDAVPVTAPMSGVFYSAPAPGKPAFVEVGQQVQAGEQLGIVEVMKLFTSLTAEADGTVVAIMVEDQQSVTKDDVLMRIESS